MATILHIDTSLETASVCLARNGDRKGFRENPNQKDHAAWLHTAVRDLAAETGLLMGQWQAIAVMAGPGSYTGLRVGLSAAKGLCYALGIPLITLNTLEVMAAATARAFEADWYCPMIDARRQEVFTAVYNKAGQEVESPRALVLEGETIHSFDQYSSIVFSGNGSGKFNALLTAPPATFVFTDLVPNASDMIRLAAERYSGALFADLAYAEPFYIKEFYHGSGVKNP